jgi:hypothetical protein
VTNTHRNESGGAIKRRRFTFDGLVARA